MNQKKKTILNYVYATLIGLLVIACAVTISVVNATGSKTGNGQANVGGDIPVAVVTFVSPMKNAAIVKDYSGKELQFNDTLKQWEIHKAIDFAPSDDLNVYAITDGTISNVYSNYLEGTVVEIAHANGLVSIYKSLESATVEIGNKVNSGSVIGQVGQTMAQELNGGTHLHLEMTLNGKKVDPNNYLDLAIK